LAPAGGTVKLAGEPLTNVQVEFWPEDATPRSTGVTDQAGRFALVADGTGKPGAVIGRHKVVLHDLNVYAEIGIRPREETNIREKPARFPPTYNDPNKTPLRVNVIKGQNDFEIAVEK
jgi:hypothetical protein